MPRILVLEDSDRLREFLEAYFTGSGYECSAAATARAALAILRSRGRIDAAVIDLILPGETGVSLLKQCRATEIPAIVYSALDPHTAQKVCPGVEVLTKPVEPAVIMSRVRRLILSSRT